MALDMKNKMIIFIPGNIILNEESTGFKRAYFQGFIALETETE